MLEPDIRVASVSLITPALLRERGIEGVLVDLDDTMVASGTEVIAEETRNWLAGLKSAGIKVLILSNGERARVARWAADLDLPSFSLVGKPFWFAFQKGLKALGTAPEKTAMIGDQLFTDVLGANLAHLTSVLVTPLSAGKLPHTKLIRRLERRILKGGHG